MELNIQYVTNEIGEKTAVQIPIKDWELLLQDYERIRQTSKIKNDLREAIIEIREIKQGKKAVLLKDFLNEL